MLVALTLALPICAQAVGEGDGWGAGAIHVPKNFKFSKLVNHGKGGVPPVATGTKGRKARQASQVLKAPQHSVFYANALGDYMGLMSYDPATPTDVTTYAPFDKSLFNAGSTIKDGKLCGLYLDQSMIEYGIIFLWYGWFDLETGEYDGEVTNVSNRSLIAYATATDPKTGEVFGEFTDQTMQSWEFGVVDYDTKTRTTIAETDNLYLAMGITSQGDCYGITDDGDLYRIDRTCLLYTSDAADE